MYADQLTPLVLEDQRKVLRLEEILIVMVLLLFLLLYMGTSFGGSESAIAEDLMPSLAVSLIT